MWSDFLLVRFLEYNIVASRPLEYTPIYDIQPGSSIRFHSHKRSCNQPGNDSYTLLQQNHTGHLEVVLQQQDYEFVISDIQLNNSGVYCAYKECVPEDMEQCCIQIMG